MQERCSKKYARSLLVPILMIAFTGCSSLKQMIPPIGEILAGTSETDKKAKRTPEAQKSPEKKNSPVMISEKGHLSTPPIWDKSIPSKGTASPAHFDGTLYVGSEEGLHALSLSTGKELWVFETDYPVQTTPAVLDKHVCFGTGDGVLFCLDRASGRELWQYRARTGLNARPLIAGDKLYFTSADLKLHALALETGLRLWSYSRSTYSSVLPRSDNTPLLVDGTLFTLFPDGYLVGLTAETGRLVWEKRLIDDPIGSTQTHSTPTLNKGSLYLFNGDGVLVEIDPATGDAREVFQTANAVDFTVNGRTAFIAGSELVAAIDLDTGNLLWKSDVPRGRSASIFSSAGRIFVLTYYTHAPWGFDVISKQKGSIEAFRQADGAYVWSRDLDSEVPARAFVSASGDYFSYVTRKGTLEVFGPAR